MPSRMEYASVLYFRHVCDDAKSNKMQNTSGKALWAAMMMTSNWEDPPSSRVIH